MDRVWLDIVLSQRATLAYQATIRATLPPSECRYRGALIGRLVTGPDGFLTYRKVGPWQRAEDAKNRRWAHLLGSLPPSPLAPRSTHPR